MKFVIDDIRNAGCFKVDPLVRMTLEKYKEAFELFKKWAS